MTNLHDREIYIVFDPNDGKVCSVHIVGISTKIPTEAIKVTGEQYLRLIEDPNWKYDWESEKLVYNKVAKKLNLEELREECRIRINAAVDSEIANGVTFKLENGTQLRLTCSLTDQQNLAAQATLASTGGVRDVFELRAYVGANFDKSTVTVSAGELVNIYAAMINHIQACRERGWVRKDYVNAPNRTIDELEVYVTKI